MNTPITDAHKRLWTTLYNFAHDEIFDVASSDGPAHKLIADSEARAVAARTAERDQLRALLVYADQILDDIDTCSDAHKPMYSSYSQNVFKSCIKGRDSRRAAIAASMKEGAK